MYDTRIGLWLNKDGAVGKPDPSNLYRYCGNDPVNQTDPSGLDGISTVDRGKDSATGQERKTVYWIGKGVKSEWAIGEPDGKEVVLREPYAKAYGNPRISAAELAKIAKDTAAGSPSDIEKALDQSAGRPGSGPKQIEGKSIQYFENVGWIDWQHANGDSAGMLLKMIRENHGKGVNAPTKWRVPNYSEGVGALAGEAVVDIPRQFYAGNKKFFVIQFRNPPYEIKEKIGYPTVAYVIQDGLDEKQIKEVALGIFKDYQMIFETWQEAIGPKNLAGLRGPKNYSGFSQEDLVSDLVGFYMAVDPEKYTRENLLRDYFGQKLDEPEALALMKKLGNELGWPENKNRTFTPVNHNDEATSLKGKPMNFPKFLSEIKPENSSMLWARLGEADWYAKLQQRAAESTKGIKR